MEKVFDKISNVKEEQSAYPIIFTKEVIINRITFRSIMEQILASFNIEKGYLFTLKKLIMSPNAAVNGYLTNERHIHINPLKLLLPIVAIATFLTFQLNLQEEYMQMGAEMYGSQEATSKATEASAKLVDVYNKYFNIFVLLSLPFIACASFWFFKKPSYNLAEHFVINCYLFAIQNGIYIVMFPLFYFFSGAFIIYFILSTLYQIYFYLKIFNVKALSGSLKTIASLITAYALYYIFLIAIGIVYALIVIK